MLPDDLVYQMQSHSGARDRAHIAGAIIALPDATDLGRRDTQAAILDRDLDHMVMGAPAEGHHTVPVRVFERVRNEVAEHLVQELPVAGHLDRQLADVRLQPSTDANFDVIAGEGREHFLEIEWPHPRLQVSLRELNRVREACNEARHPKHARSNSLGALGDIGRLRTFPRGDQPLRVPVDRHERRAKLVRNGADEVALLGRKLSLFFQRTGEDLGLICKSLARLEELNRVASEDGKRLRHLTDLVSPAFVCYREIRVVRREPPHQRRQSKQGT